MSIKRRLISIFIAILVVGGIATGVILHLRNIATVFNSTYVNGNTAGNLYNSGLFCESNGIVYFANPDDGYHLYSMTAEGSELTLLSDDVVSFINADENYIYYVRNNLSANSGSDSYAFLNINTNSLVRCDLDGDNLVVLDQDPCIYASLVGNYVYYVHYDTESASTLYRIKIDGTEKEKLASSAYLPCSTEGQNIYYNGLETDHNIYQLDSETKTATCVLTGNYWMPQVSGDTAYIMDNINNYALIKADLSTGDTTTITKDRIDCYNVYGDYIYYQKNDSETPALCRIKTDGTDFEVVADGNYTEINVTSRYVYFRLFSDNTTFYRTPTTGGINMTTFHPGKEE